MSLRGAVKAFPLDMVVQLLAATDKTGMLEVRSDTDEQRGFLGVSKGRLVSAQFDDEDGHLALGAVFAIGSGDFEFLPRDGLDRADLGGDLDELLARASQEKARIAGIREVIADEGVRFRLSERATELGQITLGAEQWRAVLLVDGERDAAAIAHKLGMRSLAAQQLLADLVRAGLIDAVGPAKAEASGEALGAYRRLPPMRPLPPTSAGEAVVLAGRLPDFPLETIVQLLAETSKTGRLEVRTDRENATLAVSDGRLVSAVWGEEEGEVALGASFTAQEGEFDFVPMSEVTIRNLSGGLDALLDRAAATRDRIVAIRGLIPSERSRFTLSDRATRNPEIVLTPEQWRVLLGVNGERDVFGVAEHLRMRRLPVMMVLADLVRGGYVDVLPAAEPTWPTVERRRAPSSTGVETPAPPEPIAVMDEPAVEAPAVEARVEVEEPVGVAPAVEEPVVVAPAVEEPRVEEVAPPEAAPLEREEPLAEAFTSALSPEGPPPVEVPGVAEVPQLEEVDPRLAAFGAPPALEPAPPALQPPPALEPALPAWATSSWSQPAATEPAPPETVAPEAVAPEPAATETVAPEEIDPRLAAFQTPAPSWEAPAQGAPAWEAPGPAWEAPVEPPAVHEEPQPEAPREPQPEAPREPLARDAAESASGYPTEWERRSSEQIIPSGPADAQPVVEPKKRGLFGGLFGGGTKAKPARATAPAMGAAPRRATRPAQLGAFANELVAAYNSGQYGKGRVEDRMLNHAMRADEQADPIDRPIPIVNDRIDVDALEREPMPERQALPYLAVVVRQIYDDAEAAHGKDKAKRGFREVRDRLFGKDLSVFQAPEVSGRMPKV